MVIKLTKKEIFLCKKQLKYYLLIIGGGGTSQGGLSAADLFIIKVKAVENLLGLHGFFYFQHIQRS